MIASLLGRLVAVMLFKAGPQHVPFSTTMLGGVYAAYFISSVLVVYPTLDVFWSAVEAIVDLAFLTAFCYYLLGLFGKRERLVQTVTTLAGVGVIIQLLAWPLLVFTQDVPAQEGAMNGFFLALFLLLLWQLVIYVHVFRYAFEVSRLRASALAILYLFLSVFIAGMIVPQQ